MNKEEVLKKLGIDFDTIRLTQQIVDHPEFKAMVETVQPRGHDLWHLSREGFKSYKLQELNNEKLSAILESLETKIRWILLST